MRNTFYYKYANIPVLLLRRVCACVVHFPTGRYRSCCLTLPQLLAASIREYINPGNIWAGNILILAIYWTKLSILVKLWMKVKVCEPDMNVEWGALLNWLDLNDFQHTKLKRWIQNLLGGLKAHIENMHFRRFCKTGVLSWTPLKQEELKTYTCSRLTCNDRWDFMKLYIV